jgi:hypothetical protein
MVVGTQFSGTLAANSTGRWFTYKWRPDWHVVWTVVSTTPGPGAAQVEWEVEVQRASPTALTYWITIRNLTGAELAIEARYAILN